MEKWKLTAYVPILLLFAFILATCGGNGGGGDGEGGDSPATISPSVTSTSPADGTTGVATDNDITAQFDEPMDASTITTATFIVQAGSSNLTGTVTYDSGTRAATFASSKKMALVTKYTVTITTGVKDIAGNAMVANFVWSFTTRDRIWGMAKVIGETGYDAESPQIAMDSSGNAIAVWSEASGNGIWANRYVVGSGWGTAEIIGTASYTGQPQIAIDSAGNAIAVWVQTDCLCAKQYVVGSGWETAKHIDTDGTGSAGSPQIAMDPAGNAIAMRDKYDGSRSGIWANRFVAGSGWGTAKPIDTDEAGNAYRPQIAMDATGNAIAGWRQDTDIWANRFE